MDDNNFVHVQTTIPLASESRLSQHNVAFKFPQEMVFEYGGCAAEFLQAFVQTSHNKATSVVQTRRLLKRRRTDEDLQQDRRRPNEDIDFTFTGITSRTHLRMKRGYSFQHGLERFAEQTGRNYAHLKLFYQERYIASNSTPDEIGLESGDELYVYERIN